MKWRELKDNIRELGFDSEAALVEAMNNVIISSNRAIDIILRTVVEKYESYFKARYSTPEKEWAIPKITPITKDTKDDFEIELPDMVWSLIPLLASYYVWLDDDERKAVYHMNDYEGLKEELRQIIVMPRKIVFQGGVNFD